MAKIIEVYPKEGKTAHTAPAWQYDYGQLLHINGITLPASYKAEFSNTSLGDTIATVQTTDTVAIPAQFLESGAAVYIWLVVVDADSRTTEYALIVPVAARAKPTDTEPTPEEQTEIEQALSVLNQAVEQTAAAVEAAGGYAEEAEQSAEAASSASENAIDAKEAAIAAKNTAETKASEAAASASNASTAAQNASMSASQANISAQNAAGSASAAEKAKNAAQSAAQSVAGAMDTLEATIKADLQAAKESGEFDGKDGTTFTPAVSADGVISWTNDGGLPNPQSQSIKGPVGATPNLTIGTIETLEPGADATAEITGTPENPVLNLGIPQGVQGEDADISNLAPIIINSASGDIASFSDGAEDMPVKALTVNVDPVQDLHGYDSPWPAGGGKNLLDWNKVSVGGTHYGMTFSKGSAEGEITISGTLTTSSGSVAPISYADTSLSGKGYVFLTERISGDSVIDLSRTYGFRTENERAIAVYLNGTAGQSYTETIRISVYAPPAPTSWTPYSNVCPITGWTGAKVTRTGKNLLNPDASYFAVGREYRYGNGAVSVVRNADGSYHIWTHGNSVRVDLPIYTVNTNTGIIVPEGAYTFTIYGNDAVKSEVHLCGSGAGDGLNGMAYFDVEKTATRTAIYGGKPLSYLFFRIFAGNPFDITVTVQMESGSTATAYEPYQGSTYDITFPTEAGTVYGGTLDVKSGVLTVDMAIIDLGTLTWKKIGTTGSHWRFWAYLNDMAYGGEMLSSQYKHITATESYLGEIGIASQTSGRNYIAMVTDERFSDAATFKTAMSGVQLVYELATPITYTLTPQEIRTLLGTNNIWADTGDTAVVYKADTKRYIDKKFAELQALILEN